MAYLDPGSRKPLLAAAEQQLVGQHLPVLLAKGFGGLLDAHRREARNARSSPTRARMPCHGSQPALLGRRRVPWLALTSRGRSCPNPNPNLESARRP